MSMLNPTPAEFLVDAAGRPYFLWDSEMTLAEFREHLRSGDEETRAWLVGKLMRQAKPGEVFSFVGLAEVVTLWPALVRYLGQTREFWTWWLEERLDAEGMETSSLQSTPTFHRLLVTLGEESTVVDLVADPVAVIEPPERVSLPGREIAVDTSHEILVNKLCALVQRSELRDLEDVRQLVARGGELGRALREAPRKDGGFSPLILGWVLRGLPIAAAARAERWPKEWIDQLESFREQMLAELGRWTRPLGE